MSFRTILVALVGILLGVVLGLALARPTWNALDAGLVAGRTMAADDTPVLARVDGEDLSLGDFELRWNELLTEEARQFHQRRGGPRSYLDEVVEEMVLAHEARRRGLENDDAVRAALRRDANRALGRQLLETEVRGKAIHELELRSYFDRNRDEWARPARVHAREILIASAPGDEEGRARAESMRERLAAGASFATLARESSASPTAPYGGEIGWIVEGQIYRPYEREALTLAAGELSPVLPVDGGWVILQVDQREDRVEPRFEDVREIIRDRLLKEDSGALSRRYRVFVDDLLRRAQVHENTELLEGWSGSGHSSKAPPK